VPRLLRSLPLLASKSGAAPSGRGSAEARTNSDVASQIPKCEPILPIRYRSGRRSRETCSLTSNTHKPEANDLVLWMTRPSRKEEFITVVKNEILPILKKQTGFLEILPFFPETMTDKVLFFSLWTEKQYFERYRKDWFPKVEEIVRPYLTTPMTYKLYTLETKLCKHFEKAMAA
jgi:quinol monooxygenase YgiN